MSIFQHRSALWTVAGLFAMVVTALAAVQARAADDGMPPTVDVAIDKNGLSELRYNGIDLLRDGGGTFRLLRADLQRPDGSTYTGWGGDEHVTRSQPEPNRIVNEYEWGRVSCEYVVQGNQLDLIVNVTNTSEHVLKEICLTQRGITLPEKAKGMINDSGFSAMIDGTGRPPVHAGDFGKGVIAYANEQVRRPLGIGAWEDGTHYKFRVWTGRCTQNENHPYIDRPIYPGGRERFRVSLRFGTPDQEPLELATDILEAGRQRHPFQVDWPDRRPIGMVMVATAGRRSENNPRGYRAARAYRPLDVTTDAGRAEFGEALLDQADRIIEVCKQINAQGVIVWDIEGVERPAAKYMGDPRSLPPEMDAHADAFFKKLRDAGLRVGVCVRHRPRPIRLAYDDQIRQQQVANPTRSTIRKIAYAKQRWNVSYIYIDSIKSSALDSLRRIHEAHPEVLLVPEHATPYSYAYGAPYNGVRHSDPRYIRVSPLTRHLYPDAFHVLSGAGYPLADDRRDVTLDTIRRGSIPMMRGWVRSRPSFFALEDALQELGRLNGKNASQSQ